MEKERTDGLLVELADWRVKKESGIDYCLHSWERTLHSIEDSFYLSISPPSLFSQSTDSISSLSHFSFSLREREMDRSQWETRQIGGGHMRQSCVSVSLTPSPLPSLRKVLVEIESSLWNKDTTSLSFQFFSKRSLQLPTISYTIYHRCIPSTIDLSAATHSLAVFSIENATTFLPFSPSPLQLQFCKSVSILLPLFRVN